jgi:glycosyltransferase involved in cell wall biosynthesis
MHIFTPARPPRISIVIPARNEARNLERLLPSLPEVHQVVLVDGQSVDGTVQVARSLMPGIDVVNQTRTGKGNALACGFAAVTGDIVVMMDADGSADPAEIPRFVEALTAGADVAKGTRFAAGGGSADITRLRRLGNRLLMGVANRALGVRFTDLCYGYNAFWADVIPRFHLPEPEATAPTDGGMLWGDGFEIETLLACRTCAEQLTVAEVPSFERERVFGASNLNAVSDGLRVLRTIVAEKQRASVVAKPRPSTVRASSRGSRPVGREAA